MLIYVIVSVVLYFCVWLKCVHRGHRRRMESSLRRFGSDGEDVRVLFVTAHPDDECMFFAPTIIRLMEMKARVHLLCLSEGNYYNQGSERRQELMNSCSLLGIPESRVTVVDHRSLPDDPRAEWSVSLVSSLISKHIKAHSINMVLTFDGRGVSGHPNHVSIFKALSHLAFSGHIPDDCCLLSLDTVGLFRKYVSLLDLPLSWTLSSSLCCFSGLMGYWRARDAMLCHRSQLLWFRHLYMVFSRYMFINTFQMIPRGPRNLRIY